MKKMLLVSLLLTVFTVAWAQAQTDSEKKAVENQKVQTVQPNTPSPGPAFVDQNGDGLCDRRPQANVNTGKGRNGYRNGTCRNRANRQGAGPGFVDANKDGVCDNRDKARQGRGQGNCGGRGPAWKSKNL